MGSFRALMAGSGRWAAEHRDDEPILLVRHHDVNGAVLNEELLVAR